MYVLKKTSIVQTMLITPVNFIYVNVITLEIKRFNSIVPNLGSKHLFCNVIKQKKMFLTVL